MDEENGFTYLCASGPSSGECWVLAVAAPPEEERGGLEGDLVGAWALFPHRPAGKGGARFEGVRRGVSGRHRGCGAHRAVISSSRAGVSSISGSRSSK